MTIVSLFFNPILLELLHHRNFLLTINKVLFYSWCFVNHRNSSCRPYIHIKTELLILCESMSRKTADVLGSFFIILELFNVAALHIPVLFSFLFQFWIYCSFFFTTCTFSFESAGTCYHHHLSLEAAFRCPSHSHYMDICGSWLNLNIVWKTPNDTKFI